MKGGGGGECNHGLQRDRSRTDSGYRTREVGVRTIGISGRFKLLEFESTTK